MGQDIDIMHSGCTLCTDTVRIRIISLLYAQWLCESLYDYVVMVIKLQNGILFVYTWTKTSPDSWIKNSQSCDLFKDGEIAKYWISAKRLPLKMFFINYHTPLSSWHKKLLVTSMHSCDCKHSRERCGIWSVAVAMLLCIALGEAWGYGLDMDPQAVRPGDRYLFSFLRVQVGKVWKYLQVHTYWR